MIEGVLRWLGDSKDTLQDIAFRTYESLWFRPMCWLFMLCALALTLVFVEWFYIETAYWESWFVLWRSQADGAKTMLGAVAGATLTVVSLAFSLMMVVVIQTANAYSPRLLGQFIADRHNHHVLGLLMGSFAYALLTLRSIREDPDFVPHIAVNVALLLSIASIIALISFIQNVAQSIQVANIILLIESQTLEALSHKSERALGEPYEREYALNDAHIVSANHSGYIRVMERDQMEQLLEHEGSVVEWHKEVGDYMLEGSPLATIWHVSVLDEEQIKDLTWLIRDIITVGPQRAWFHDTRYGFQQLTDIALKALSPGINDPTTAVMALHALTKLSREVLLSHAYHEHRANEAGDLKLMFRKDWVERLMHETFWQIRHYGKEDVMVMETLIEHLGQLLIVARDRVHFEVMCTCVLDMADAVEFESWSEPQRHRISAAIREVRTRVAITRHSWTHGESLSDVERAVSASTHA